MTSIWPIELLLTGTCARCLVLEFSDLLYLTRSSLLCVRQIPISLSRPLLNTILYLSYRFPANTFEPP